VENVAAQEDWSKIVDEDIRWCEETWDAYSYDKDIMGELYHVLLSRYTDVIVGFDKDMLVISPYDSVSTTAEIYRRNVALILQRLKEFRANGYTNTGLEEYRLRNEDVDPVSFDMNFAQVRLSISQMDGLSLIERDEILKKLEQMEDICNLPITKREKWDMMRGYVIWVSGRDLNVAIKILPLFLKMTYSQNT